MFTIQSITTNENNISIFSQQEFPLSQRGGMMLSEQIGAKNFRVRQSRAGYSIDWHMSGDATWIIIQQGTLRISLQNGDYKDFKPGDQFIAADNLPVGTVFDATIHGHKAEVIGEHDLLAVHIKLENWSII